MIKVDYKPVTVDAVVDEANLIRKKRKDSKLDPEQFLEKIWSEHRDFSEAYPLVLRYIAYDLGYHPKALRKWIDWVKYHPWKTTDEYLEAQARYVYMLHRELNPRLPNTEHQRVYDETCKRLKDEYRIFRGCVEKARQDQEKLNKKLMEKNRSEFIEAMSKWGDKLLSGLNKIMIKADLRPDDTPDVDRMLEEAAAAKEAVPAKEAAEAAPAEETAPISISAADLLG